MEGFSETQLNNHFTLYKGYVTNTNKALDMLSSMLKDGKAGSYEWAEVKRRLGWEFNGMRLHELYFSNLGGDGSPDSGAKIKGMLEKQYGGYENWEKDFKAVGAMRGIGWAILYHDPSSDFLVNMWINEHDVAHPAGCTPLLIMDVFEHAFVFDYGLKRPDYIAAFFSNIDWNVVNNRLG
jgi:Fe-Mn family superoxide dismutase